MTVDLNAVENQNYRREFAEKQKHFAAAGLTEEDYVASRRIDDGLDVLGAPGSGWRGLPAAPPTSATAAASSPTRSPARQPENQGYVQEFEHNRAAFEAAGLTVQDYIRSRRIDDGRDVLKPELVEQMNAIHNRIGLARR